MNYKLNISYPQTVSLDKLPPGTVFVFPGGTDVSLKTDMRRTPQGVPTFQSHASHDIFVVNVGTGIITFITPQTLVIPVKENYDCVFEV